MIFTYKECLKIFDTPIRKGMCHACYSRTNYKKSTEASNCHPEKFEYRQKLCRACYLYSKNTGQAVCHPSEPVSAKGLCQSCYQKEWMTPERRRRHNALPGSRAARQTYEKLAAPRASMHCNQAYLGKYGKT